MKKDRIVWIVIFIIGLGMRSTELFHPINTSTWRENDESSIARNYYRNGMDLFHPQIDWGGNGPGYVESEFPIYPYLIAASYKLFGLWEPTGRVISFLFSLGTMLIFFRLCRFLFNKRTAFACSIFFTLSPLLSVMSIAIQPESVMFFFYISAAYSFCRWIDSESRKYYLLTFIFTALTLLCKITAINIGILFALTLITKKGWRYVLKPEVIFLAILTVIPSFIWYAYCHRFYLLYGNSLGLSNEYPWVGWDFFTNPYYITGIIKQDLGHIWTYAGPIIIILALFSTKMIRRQDIIFPFFWLIAAATFYIIAARTTADAWAAYYHIFSVPYVSMFLGISVIEITDKYFPKMDLNFKPFMIVSNFLKSSFINIILLLFVSFFVVYSFRYLILTTKPSFYKASSLYECKDPLSAIIPKGSLILVSGGRKADGKYPTAYNSSYFFYWLDRKGYNISLEDQSIENVLAFKGKGAEYFVAEIGALSIKPGFEDVMRKTFKAEFEGNGIILFKL